MRVLSIETMLTCQKGHLRVAANSPNVLSTAGSFAGTSNTLDNFLLYELNLDLSSKRKKRVGPMKINGIWIKNTRLG